MKWMVLFMFGGLGLAALIGGAMWGLKRYSLIQNGIQTRGKVVAQEEFESTETGETNSQYTRTVTSYYPVVEFRTSGGERIRFRGSSGGAGKPLIETGTEVDVIYDRGNTSNAQIRDFTQFWLGPVVAAGAGLIFFLMGVGVFFLIGGQDREFASQFEMMKRQSLLMRRDSIVAKGTIVQVKEEGGKYRFLCKATRPGSTSIEDFYSDHFDFNPGSSFLGKEIDIYIDPGNKDSYYVNVDPLLPEIVKRTQ